MDYCSSDTKYGNLSEFIEFGFRFFISNTAVPQSKFGTRPISKDVIYKVRTTFRLEVSHACK